jgi:endoglucanase
MHQVPPPRIFQDKSALDQFRKLWKGLAAHYVNRSPNIVYELLNEPNVNVLSDENKTPKPAELDHWRSIMKDLVGAIREEDPDHYVIVTGGDWSGPKGLIQMGNLEMPKLVYTFHCYEPMVFTHQGATWVGKPMEGIRGVKYPVTEEEIQKLWADAKKNHEGEWPFTQYPKGFNKKNMKEWLKPVLEFGKKEKLILYCGEFGVHKPYAPPASRARWIADYVSLMKENKVAWAMWAYHAGFDLVDEKGKPLSGVVKALGLK